VFIQDRLKGWNNEIARAVLLDHADHGSRLWKLYEITWKQGEHAGKTELFIAMDVIGEEPGAGWWYRDVEEGSGDFENDCPLKFLDLVPNGNDSAWRARVREYWVRQGQVQSETQLNLSGGEQPGSPPQGHPK
jgi:hypothetical protein